MKQVAFLEYSFMFDPSEAWSNGYQFENQLADFFTAYGFEARIIQTAGGTGRRIIFVERIDVPKTVEPISNQLNTTEQIKKIAQKVPTKSFKDYRVSGVPRGFVNKQAPPKLNYDLKGHKL